MNEDYDVTIPGSQKLYFSLAERKIKTIRQIFKILHFLSQGYSDLNFHISRSVFLFNLAELCNF